MVSFGIVHTSVVRSRKKNRIMLILMFVFPALDWSVVKRTGKHYKRPRPQYCGEKNLRNYSRNTLKSACRNESGRTCSALLWCESALWSGCKSQTSNISKSRPSILCIVFSQSNEWFFFLLPGSPVICTSLFWQLFWTPRDNWCGGDLRHTACDWQPRLCMFSCTCKGVVFLPSSQGLEFSSLSSALWDFRSLPPAFQSSEMLCEMCVLKGCGE